ncbi:MAG: neutral/alkaline non-lysosomal ceramidase N-terminal domain-containing protein [Anaerolineaceae bacterium]|nr:neutral/alkaline non-lysosomal ceramidase N-terminal domain-containing protein [Anaerolineaceae bacterium]
MILDTLHGSATQIDITPPIGTSLEGYAARTQPSIGIHDPLYASLIFLKLGNEEILLISLDQIALSAVVSEHIRAAICAQTNLKPEDILIVCTHTHAGPSGYISRFPMLSDSIDPFLVDLLSRKLAGAALELSTRLQPVSLELGRDAIFGLGRNRNDLKNELQDHELLVLVMKSVEGQALALWVNFGCHPTVLGYENRLISADYPGAARKAIQRQYPGLVWCFSNGAAGDISTRFTRRGQNFAEVERSGLLLAGSVLKAMQTAEPMKVDKLSGKMQQIELPLREFGSVETARSKAKALEQSWQEMKASGEASAELRKAMTKAEGAQAQVMMAEFYAGRKSIPSYIHFIKIGAFDIIGIPGETFTRTVLEIKALGDGQGTVVCSYSNDYCGYFPDPISVQAGTYEALVSPFSEHVADILIEKTASYLKGDSGAKH